MPTLLKSLDKSIQTALDQKVLLYFAMVKPTNGVNYGGYNAVPTLLVPTGFSTINTMSISSNTLGVVAPVAGIMTISGNARWSTLGTAAQAFGFINGVAVGETFVAFGGSTQSPVPTISMKVAAGDIVAMGIGGDPSNIFGADQTRFYFTLIPTPT